VKTLLNEAKIEPEFTKIDHGFFFSDFRHLHLALLFFQ